MRLWEGNIKTDFKIAACEGEDWTYVAQNRD
jgi:hypothetical protein